MYRANETTHKYAIFKAFKLVDGKDVPFIFDGYFHTPSPVTMVNDWRGLTFVNGNFPMQNAKFVVNHSKGTISLILTKNVYGTPENPVEIFVEYFPDVKEYYPEIVIPRKVCLSISLSACMSACILYCDR